MSVRLCMKCLFQSSLNFLIPEIETSKDQTMIKDDFVGTGTFKNLTHHTSQLYPVLV